MTAINFQIPKEFELQVKTQEKLDKGRVLAKKRKTQTPHIALYNILDIRAEEIGKYLLKNKGEKVKRGEVIAKKRGIFSTTQVKSPAEGVLRYSKDMAGHIIISSEEREEIRTPVEGVVRNIEGNKIIVESDAEVVFAIGGAGSCRGEILNIENKGSIFTIDKRVEGKIVCRRGLDSACSAKISALGGAGVVSDKKIKNVKIAFLIVEDIGEVEEFVGREGEIVNFGGHYLVVY